MGISVGSENLSTTTYENEHSSLVKEFEYGNNVKKEYTYDDQDRLVSEKLQGIEKVRYIYNKLGNVAQVNDYSVNVTTKFSYDLIGRITGITSSDGQKLNYNYDALNRLKKTKWSLADISLNYEYIYGEMESIGEKTNMLYGVKTNGIEDLKYTYDGLCRLKTKTLATYVPYTINYGYREGAESGSTTNLIAYIDNGGRVLEYYYDNNGNINVVTENGAILWLYYYDGKNQLTRAQDYFDTYDYTYDNNGNILSASKNGETIKTYTYGNANWKDLLTQYNGQTITYDTIGNPLQYRDGMNFTWANGRQLSTVTNGANNYSYTYNADGLRTAKTVNGTTTNYYWSNGILQAQKTGDEYLIFLYDENGSAYGFLVKNGTTEEKYYYIFNAQGDVIGIIDSTGAQVVNYTYGAWGDILSVTGTLASTIGQTNPIRYRGYYYDSETGFYYLQTRYYDPEICRFINADNQLSIGSDLTGLNLFAYCGNNPVNRMDPTGEAWWHWAIGAAVVAVAAVATVVTCGGFAAAVGAVAAVGSGFAAATTASTIAAGAFIGSATAFGMAAMTAAATSSSIEEFNDQGNWGTVISTTIGGLSGAYDGYTISKTQTATSTSTGRGTQNPKVKAAVQKGQAMHKQMDYGPGVLKEKTIAPGCRVDGRDFNNRIIYELKPNNPQAIARGINQLNRYTSAASQQFGGTWTGVLKLYD